MRQVIAKKKIKSRTIESCVTGVLTKSKETRISPN